MASLVTIYNKAIAGIGASAMVADPDEASSPAQACSLHYPSVRDTLLSSFDWSFARGRALLGDLGTPPDGWSYRYAYPSDCLRAHGIWQGYGIDYRITYEVGSELDENGGDRLVLYSDQAAATLVYTRRFQNEELFPALFVEALSWSLASAIAKPLGADTQARNEAMQRADYWLRLAQAADANEGQPKRDEHIPEWDRARGTEGLGWPDCDPYAERC